MLLQRRMGAMMGLALIVSASGAAAQAPVDGSAQPPTTAQPAGACPPGLPCGTEPGVVAVPAARQESSPAPRTKGYYESMMTAGIVLTSLGIAMVPTGLGMWLGTPSPPHSSDCLCFSVSDTQIAGLVILTVGCAVMPAVGIPLWVHGAKRRRPDARAASASWTFAPLTVPSPRGSSVSAPTGLAVVGAF